LVLMGYLNPVEAMGYEAFAEAARSAGVDGVLTVDLPPEESRPLGAALGARAIDTIFLIAPTTTPERIRSICAAAGGFVYYVSLKGVTGAAHLDVAAVAQRLVEVRRHTDLPLGVGFGIRDAATAARIARTADAVIVGSALVQRIAERADHSQRMFEEISSLLASMRRTMDETAVAAFPTGSQQTRGEGADKDFEVEGSQ
jgi:tryptophan synthase alpha chain